MSSYRQSLNSYQRHTCYLGQKNFHIYAACFALILSSFVDPYERFVMLLKSRSRTLHPHMHYSYTGSRRKNMPFHLDPPKNVLLQHWEKTPKIFLIGYLPNKCSKFLLLSLKSFVAVKRSMWLCKSYSKKGEKKKWTSVRDIENNGYSDASLKKEKK